MNIGLDSMEGKIAYPEPPEQLLRGRWWRLLAFFGPGAIMASVTIGSGETVFASRIGATFGYALLWCLLAGALMKGVQVYGGMRFMVLTGRHPAESWGRLPGPRGWFPFLLGLISVVCFPFWVAGLAMMLGTLSKWIFHLDNPARAQLYTRLWATFYIAVGVTVTLLQSYGFLEKAELLIVGLLLLCLCAAAVASRPDWLAVALGAVVPRTPGYEPWVAAKYPAVAARPPWVEIATVVGAVGGGTYDYIGYLGMLREKAWGMLARTGAVLPLSRDKKIGLPADRREVEKAKAWLRAPLVDCAVSFGAVMVFSAAFLILGARILRPQHLIPDGLQLLNHQAQFLTRIHPLLLYVYQAGIFFAFFGTIVAAYEVNTRTTAECLRGISDKLGAIRLPHLRRAVVAYCGLVGLGLVWLLERPVEIVTFPAMLGGVFACGLWCFAVLWAEKRFLPEDYRMPLGGKAATVVAGTVMVTIGLIGLWLRFVR